MISHQDLPDNPMERAAELRRRIEIDIARIVRRRRWWLRIGIATGLCTVVGGGWAALRTLSAPPPLPDTHIARAVELRDAGALDEAIRELRAGLEIEPGRLGARRMLAELYLAVGEGKEAERHFVESAKSNRSRVETLGLMASRLLQRRYPEVEKQAADFLARSGRNEEAELLLASAQSGRGALAAASATLDDLLSMQPGNEAGMVAAARVALAARDTSGAREHLAGILANARRAPLTARVLEGETALARGDPAAARHAFETALADAPNHPDPRLGLARAALAVGDLVEARAQLDALPEPARAAATARYLTAALAWQAQDRSAEASAKDLLGSEPRHHDARFLVAQILYEQGAIEPAEQHLETLLARGAEDADALALLAAIRLESGRPDSVVELLAAVVETEDAPASPRLRELLGRAYRDLGDTEKAEAHLPADRDPATAPAAFDVAALRASGWRMSRCRVIVFQCERCASLRECI